MSDALEESLSNEEVISDEYFKKCNVVITDFGNLINEGEIFDENGEIEEIQTRYYRASTSTASK